jgi:hypothetical protein
MSWCKQHREEWLGPQLRACGRDARLLLADLMALSGQDGRVVNRAQKGLTDGQIALACDVPMHAAQVCLTTLEAAGFLRRDGETLVVVSVEEDHKYAQTRVMGGKARHAKEGKKEPRKRVLKRCRKDAGVDADSVLGKTSASPSGSSSSSPSGSESSPEGEVQGREGPPNLRPVPAPDPDEPPMPPELRTTEFCAAWLGWIEYRRQRGFDDWAPLTVERKFAKWAKWGPERAAAALWHSIESNWQGVFEPKPDSGHGPPGAPGARLNPFHAELVREQAREAEAAAAAARAQAC